jgi:hypothetical protein
LILSSFAFICVLCGWLFLTDIARKRLPKH